MAKIKNKGLLLVTVLSILAGNVNTRPDLPQINNGIGWGGASLVLLPMVLMGLGSSAVLCVLGYFKTKRRLQLKGKNLCLRIHYSDLKNETIRQMKSKILQDALLNQYQVFTVLVHENSKGNDNE